MSSAPDGGDADDPTSPSTYRFRVNRINSVVSGHHKAGANPVQTIREEESDESTAYVTAYPLDTIPASPDSPGENNSDLCESSAPGANRGRAERSNSKINLIGRVAPARRPSGTQMANTGSNSGPPPVVRKFSLAGILGRRKSSNLPDIEDFAQYNSTVGAYGKSLNRYTNDALPKLENYRNFTSFNAQQRPTIDELHEQRFRNPNKVCIPFLT